jgi:predicted small lipoprotein YifL
MRRTSLLLLVTLVAASLSLAACGKKGPPEDVPGGNHPSTYPTR